MQSALDKELNSSELKDLCQVLWAWPFCVDCKAEKQCHAEAWSLTCFSWRLRRLKCFTEYYRRQCIVYLDATEYSPRSLKTHTDLLRLIEKIRSRPDLTKVQLINGLEVETESRSSGQGLAQSTASADLNLEFTVELAARIMLMVNCFSQSRGINILEQGLHQIPWQRDVPFDVYADRLFPVGWKESPQDASRDLSDDLRAKLTAGRLKKHLGLNFRPTDDLTKHLELDRQSNTVEVFRHTTVLKEHLRLSKNAASDLPMADYLRLGVLPRQLVLEVLESIQGTLFPINDPKSRMELRSLIRKSGFDSDAEHFEHTALRNSGEQRVKYMYLSSRLIDLYDELQDPKPRGWLEEWLERRSGGRYVMLATLIGVIIAILLGLAGLAVAIFQAWVSYQTWKYPVPTIQNQSR